MSPMINTSFSNMSEYEKLVSRLEHIDRAFIIRRHLKLHYAKDMPKEATQQYIKIVTKYREFFNTYEESLLWFISVEIHSRFLAGSKKGLYQYICGLDDNIREKYKDKLSNLGHIHSDTICYIKTQRNQFLAHADDVNWDKFPNVFDRELDNLISYLKKLVNQIGADTKELRQVSTDQNLAAIQTNKLFDDLLLTLEPSCSVDKIRIVYNNGVKDFIKE